MLTGVSRQDLKGRDDDGGDFGKYFAFRKLMVSRNNERLCIASLQPRARSGLGSCSCKDGNAVAWKCLSTSLIELGLYKLGI